MKNLARLEKTLAERIPEWCSPVRVPGFVAGVFHKGEQIELAWGTANLNTSSEMTTDTLWLLGSVTNILTTTLLLRYVERGQVDLDQPVTTYLPDFRLSEPGAAERISVRRLVNHTNGIDADTLMPTFDFGPGAVKSYVDTMAQCGTLFAPGESIHYTNPGFSLAARIIEVLSGTTFNQALEDEIFAPIGMERSCTSAAQAILYRTAIGSFPDVETDGARPTEMFMLPVSGAGAGATPIVTVPDIIAFGRTHLDGGVAPNGTRVLAAELVEAMRAQTFDLGTPNAPPMGLGWWLAPIGGTSALWHGGGSPGGTSSLAVFPEHDLVVASFGNGKGSPLVHDAVVQTVLEDHLGLQVGLPFEPAEATIGMERYAGTYSSFQFRLHIDPSDDGLTLQPEFVPFDEEHERFLSGYEGGQAAPPKAELVPVRDNLFVLKDAPLEMYSGMWGRMGLMSFHGDDGEGRPAFAHMRFRNMPREK
jgi:CubicO group peptidase (beta-lactamase class C family)